MSEYIQPFDFKEIFLNTFLGGTNLFVFALIFVYSLIASKAQMSGRLYLLLLFVISLLFAAYIGQAIYILFILVFGLISFKVLSRIFA